VIDLDKLGTFYLGRRYDAAARAPTKVPMLYDAKDLTTHGVCVGMTGSGKTGLCVTLLEEAALDGIPALCIDPKGDLGNLLLTFPELRPADFEPWIDPAEAERKGRSVADHAREVAETWRRGLATWGQDPSRIARFRDAIDLAIYTPGSSAGRPLRMLGTLDPPAPSTDADSLREAVTSAVSSLLALLDIEPDPVNSKEHVLLSNLVAQAWNEEESLGLDELIRRIGDPPLERIGVMEVESFYPSADRQRLAMRLNAVLASPSFAAWLEGDPLDIQRLLWTEEGQPRLTILSIAHLSDAERMFFVSALLARVVSWMRQQAGTSSLRAIVYMDEVFGFLPPVAEPASKRPLLSLLKQARAYGLGVLLATQNPVDLDYKALSNCGTWFLGRLQTERDVARVIDGLEGASQAAGQPLDRGEVERLLAGLGSRVFLMNDAHRDAPVLFHTRWAMSYLRGPLTRSQIRTLTPERDAGSERPSAAPGVPVACEEPPIVDAGISQFFVDEGPGPYALHLLATASLHYVRAAHGLDRWEEHLVASPLGEGEPWQPLTLLRPDGLDLSEQRPEGATFVPVPRGAVGKKQLRSYAKQLKSHLYQHRPERLWWCKELKLRSESGESQADFAARVQLAAREARDERLEAVRDKLAKKRSTLQRRIERAQARVVREEDQYEQQKLQTGISAGAAILGAILGGRGLGRATTTARGAGRIARERQDVERAQRDVEQLMEDERALEAELEEALLDIQNDPPFPSAPDRRGHRASEEVRPRRLRGPARLDAGSEAVVGRHDFFRRFDELDQHPFTADRSFFVAFRMDEADSMTRRTRSDAARCEAYPLLAEPSDCRVDVVDPQADVVERWCVDSRLFVGVDRLHQIDFHRERACAHRHDVLVDVFFLALEASRRNETERVDPKSA